MITYIRITYIMITYIMIIYIMIIVINCDLVHVFKQSFEYRAP